MTSLFVLAAAMATPVPETDLAIDGAITLGAAAAAAALFHLHPVLAERECPCDRREVNGFDRGAVGNDWSTGEPLADVALMLALAGPVLASAARAEDSRRLLSDTLLIAESAALAALATQVAKTAVARPYPYMYERQVGAEQLQDGDNYASFWSGHAALAMASGTTFSYLTWRREPDSPIRWIALIVTPLLAAAAGSLQMSAGNHFPSDLLAGLAAGGLTGLANAWLHE